jgi:hypothetical protein
MTLDGTVLAEVDSPATLHAALRRRAEALQVTRETLDAVTGLTSGYSSKLLSPTPQKSLGAVSMPAVLGALGCRLVLLADPAAERFLRRLPKRQRRGISGSDHWRSKRKAASAASALQAASAAMNAARTAKLSPEQRRSIASAAARARWDARRR